MTRYILKKRFSIRNKKYEIWVKPDGVKITELRANGSVQSEIRLPLESAADLCDRLESLIRFYEKFRPLPKTDVIRREFMEEDPETGYGLELRVEDYRQLLVISQNKARWTRTPCPSITVLDTGLLYHELVTVVNELQQQYEVTVQVDANGIRKVVRGDRMAVIYCPSRPWPWNVSHRTEALLFEPNLAGMIIFGRPVRERIEFVEQSYPDLMNDFYVDMNGDIPVEAFFEDLRVRWVRRGSQFRINDFDALPGAVIQAHEDIWYTA